MGSYPTRICPKCGEEITKPYKEFEKHVENCKGKGTLHPIIGKESESGI